MTKQEAFNKVWDYYLVQGNAPAVVFFPEGGNNCLYCTDDGRRCAVGCLLPLEVAQSLKGIVAGVDDLLRGYRETVAPHLRLDDAPKTEVDFYLSLQQCHDDCAPTTVKGGVKAFQRLLRRSLIEFADDWELEVPEEQSVGSP